MFKGMTDTKRSWTDSLEGRDSEVTLNLQLLLHTPIRQSGMWTSTQPQTDAQ